MHYLWQGHERLDVAPVTYVVIVEVEELELGQASEDLGGWQIRNRVVAQVDLLEASQALQVHQILLLQEVALQVCDGQVLAPRQRLYATRQLLVPQRDDPDVVERFALREPEEQLFSNERVVTLIASAAVASHVLIQPLAKQSSFAGEATTSVRSTLLVVDVKVVQWRLHG